MEKIIHNIPFKYKFLFRDSDGVLTSIPSFKFILRKSGSNTDIINTEYLNVNNNFYEITLTLSVDTGYDETYYFGSFFSDSTPLKNIVFLAKKQNFIAISDQDIRDILGVTESELPDNSIDIDFQYSLLSEEDKFQIESCNPLYLRILKLKTALSCIATLYNSLIKEETNGTNTRIRNAQSLKDIEASLQAELNSLQEMQKVGKCKPIMPGFGAVQMIGFTGPKGFIRNC